MGDSSAPPGCVSERLSKFAPRTVLEHEELAASLRSDGEGGHIPHQLQVFLESVKRQYLEFTRTMGEPGFKTRVEADIAAERQKRGDLQKRERQLKAQASGFPNIFF